MSGFFTLNYDMIKRGPEPRSQVADEDSIGLILREELLRKI